MVKMSSSKKKNGKHTHRVSEKERVQFDLCVMKCHLSTVRSVNTILLSYAYKCFHKYHSESYGRRKTGACCAKQRYKNGKKSTATETIRNSTKMCVYVCVCACIGCFLCLVRSISLIHSNALRLVMGLESVKNDFFHLPCCVMCTFTSCQIQARVSVCVSVPRSGSLAHTYHLRPSDLNHTND